MAAMQQHCPKCGGHMEQGFVLDNVHVHGLSQWAPGVPQKSFWTGTKLPPGVLPLGAFRCSSCGYIEYYAREEFAAQ